MSDKPTPSQLQALKLALPSGWLRRLPGGYWVGDETRWHGNAGAIHVPGNQYVGTQTVRACATRGWLEQAQHFPRVRLTDAGRALGAAP